MPERAFECVEVVEWHRARGEGWIDLRTNGTGPTDGSPLFVQDNQGLVDRAVVAPVIDDDLWLSSEESREPKHEPIGVGSTECKLPFRQTEPRREVLGHDHRVGTRKHRGKTPLGLRNQRIGHFRTRVSDHRTGIAQTKIDVLIAVHIDESTTISSLDEERERTRPACHPRHRDT